MHARGGGTPPRSPPGGVGSLNLVFRACVDPAFRAA